MTRVSLVFCCLAVGVLTWTGASAFTHATIRNHLIQTCPSRANMLSNKWHRGRSLASSTNNDKGAGGHSEPFPGGDSPSSSSKSQPKNVSERKSADLPASEPSTFSASPITRVNGDALTSNALTSSGVPSYKSILLFTSTTILIWLSEPLLSLVDTTVVGMTSSSVAPLAALGPATMLIDSCVYLCYFLSIATTNSIAKHLAQDNPRALQQTTSHVLGVATLLGTIVMGVVYGLGRPLLTWMAGSAQASSLVPLALQYCRIRCIVAPISILGMVAQSICLACLDTKTPAKAVVVASALNVVGDILLAKRFGLAGAAIATAVASVVSSLVLLREVRMKMNTWQEQHAFQSTGRANGTTQLTRVVDGAPVLNQTGPFLKAMVEPAANNATAANSDGANVPSVPQQHNRQADTEARISFMSFPDKSSFAELCRLAGPIFFVLLGKIICYSGMTLRVTDFGMIPLACHNIMMRIFFFYTTFGDSLSQAMQSYLPQVLVRKGASRTRSVKTLLSRLSKMGAAIGIANFVMAKWILHTCGQYFTSNPEILSMMKQHSTFMSLALLLHPFIMTFEGAMIATHDLLYLVGNYALTMGLLFAQLRFATTSFAGVWIALFVFQALRLTQFSSRVWNKTVRERSTSDNADGGAEPLLSVVAAA